MRYFRKTLFWLVKLIGLLVSIVLLYFLLALLLTIIPTNHAPQPANGVQIFVMTNGVHTDFVLPVDRPEMDWLQYIPISDFKRAHHPRYITFGWGDKGFYIETPEWSDLKASTAFKALFFLSSTAMHVSYMNSKPIEDKDCKSIILTEKQYEKLINYIQGSFKKNADGNVILIPGKGYDAYDNFYEANGTYSLIKTCNGWLNNGLKNIGVKTAIWAPFDKCIFYRL